MDKIIRFVSANCLLIWILLGAAGSVSAQRFEWVRGYAAGENVAIVGSVTDSVGNLYILGSMNRNSCWENGSRLLPIVPQGGQDNGDVLIAKVSPDGDLVWHKVIHGNYTRSEPHDIKPLGDTAFACLVTMPLATTDYYLYYLDTMIHSGRTIWDPNSGDTVPWPDYPMSAVGVGLSCLALITLDFDGRVLEQHFLQMSFLKRDGEDIFYVIPPNAGANTFLNTSVPENPSFAIDSEGNIYLSRRVNDYTSGGPYNGGNYSLADGTISAVKFWCDGRMVGVVPADSALASSPQILKFSPHFDTLTNSRFLFQKHDVASTLYTHLVIDDRNRLYLNCELHPIHQEGQSHGIVTVDSLQYMSFYVDAIKNGWKSIIVRFDTLLMVNRLVLLEDSVVDSINYMGLYYFNDIAFDKDSGLMFVTGWPCRNAWGDTLHNYSFFTFDGERTRLQLNAFVLILDEETLNLKSYGQLNSAYRSRIMQPFIPRGNLVCANNRIFFQSDFSGSIRYPCHTLQTPVLSTPGMCLNIFDYKGNMIAGVDYQSYSSQNRTGPLQLHDSTLYICAQLSADATFGDIQMASRGVYTCVIAKYTDTSFMHPYRPPVVGIPAADTAGVTVYPNPATDRIRVALTSGEPVVEAYVITLAGVRRRVAVAGGIVDLTGVPSGILFLQLITPTRIVNHKIIKL